MNAYLEAALLWLFRNPEKTPFLNAETRLHYGLLADKGLVTLEPLQLTPAGRALAEQLAKEGGK